MGFSSVHRGPVHFGEPLGINVVLAFNMGTDMESILTSPIGQPMAAVRFSPHLLSRNTLTSNHLVRSCSIALVEKVPWLSGL